MNGQEVGEVLRRKRVTELHHANTVTTSCTFLQLGGLASRGHVEGKGLSQTPQYTDAADKQFGIWNDIFVDSVDIHERASRRNCYGPVLFVLDAAIIDHLPPGSEVVVMKKNPTKWVVGEPDERRYFSGVHDLDENFSKGEFDHMIVIRGGDGLLPFQSFVKHILVDDPGRCLTSGQQAIEWAEGRLKAAFPKTSGCPPINRRACLCGCVQQYGDLRATDLDRLYR